MTDELWRHDPDRIVAAVQTTARMLIDLRDTANEVADRYAREARAQGHDFDTRIDYNRGSAAGYSVALATLAGAIGVPAPLLAADIPSTRVPPMARPVLPGELGNDRPICLTPGCTLAPNIDHYVDEHHG